MPASESRRSMGARAVSIGLVIVAHLSTGSGLPILWRLHLGAIGVRTFFVISGFIITTLLLQEYGRTRRISVSGFYIRRAARILPAYWLFVLSVALLIPTGLVQARYADLPAVLAYFSNYSLPSLAFGHTWSLSVEEQFYLLWPAAIVLAGIKNARVVCVVLVIVAPAFRIASDLGLWPGRQNFAFECVCDSLALGCLLALLRTRLWAVASYRRLIASPYLLFGFVATVALMAVRPESIVSDLGISLLNLSIAATLDRYMRFSGTVIGRLLNSTPFVLVGTISYGLYLWQQLFTFAKLPLAVKIAAPVCLAVASFYFVETPARRWLTKSLRARTAAPLLPAKARSA